MLKSFDQTRKRTRLWFGNEMYGSHSLSRSSLFESIRFRQSVVQSKDVPVTSFTLRTAPHVPTSVRGNDQAHAEKNIANGCHLVVSLLFLQSEEKRTTTVTLEGRM